MHLHYHSGPCPAKYYETVGQVKGVRIIAGISSLKGPVQVFADAEGKQVLVPKLYLAKNPWSRLRGLMFQKHLAKDDALLLSPCNGVHTFFMRFPIDVFYLNKQLQILFMYRARPWRILPLLRHAEHVLEAPAEGGLLSKTTIGQQLFIEGM